MVFSLAVGVLSDSASTENRLRLVGRLSEEGYELVDLGPYAGEPEEPDSALAGRAIRALQAGLIGCCVLVDVSGNGLQIHANENPAVRAASCATPDAARAAVNDYRANMCDVASPEDNLEPAVSVLRMFLQEFEKVSRGGQLS
jgi:ribose 5-phosphate isomerase B